MKLRYYLDRKKENDGLIVLEADPQMRRLLIYSQNSQSKYVPLPYVYFTVRFTKDPLGGFRYPGVYGAGLHVYCSPTPIKAITDSVCYMPTDQYPNNGVVCTTHSYDKKKFDTIPELVNTVIGIWFGLVHNQDYQPFKDPWQQVKLDSISNGKWIDAGPFYKILNTPKTYGKGFISVPKDGVLIEENWPTTLVSTPYYLVKSVEKSKPAIAPEADYDDDVPLAGCDCEICQEYRRKAAEKAKLAAAELKKLGDLKEEWLKASLKKRAVARQFLQLKSKIL